MSFSVSHGVINIHPKLSPDEVEDEREIRNFKVRTVIQASHAEFVAGKSRPAEEFFVSRQARARKRSG